MTNKINTSARAVLAVATIVASLFGPVSRTATADSSRGPLADSNAPDPAGAAAVNQSPADSASVSTPNPPGASAVDGGMIKVATQTRTRLTSARIQFASPAVGDLDHDLQYQEIVVGTSDGLGLRH